ncbi:CLUMA_CG021294, isoform A, partial [Clunio marinus]
QIPDTDVDEGTSTGWYEITGKVYSPEIGTTDNWQDETQIIINGGEMKGFLKNDGTFVISKVPSGSYVVEILNPNYMYEAVRVEINNKGKFRARKVNHVQPSQVLQVPYPLKLKALTTFRYFQQREQWKITDFLFSPMVLMMILPLILLVLLPRIMSDPETKKEMENLQLPKLGGDMPEMSEMISKFFGGGTPQPKPSSSSGGGSGKTNKKRN